MVKLNDRLNTLQTQNQPPPPPSSSSRPSLNRQYPPNIPPRPNQTPTWTNQDFHEPDFSMENLPTTSPDRPRLKDYLAAMKPDTWGSSSGRPSKRSSVKRDENMYIPPPPSMPNVMDNNHIYSNNVPSNAQLYSSVPSTAGPALTSLSTFSPHHYPVQSPISSEHHPSSFVPQQYQQPKPNQLYSNDPGSTLLAQSVGGAHQGNYNVPNTQPFAQHQQFHPSQQPVYQSNLSSQQTFHQPPPTQPLVRQPSPSPQTVYHPPLPQQQSIYQPPPHQQPMHQPPPPQQPIYQPPPSQQSAYQPPTPQHAIYHPPPSQQSVYQPPPPTQQQQQPMYQPSPAQQSTYQSIPPQQPMYQPTYQTPTSQNPMYQIPPTQQPTHPSFLQQPTQPINQHQIFQTPQTNPTQQPTAFQNQNITDTNRSVQPSLPSAKFDPYRPQPIGAYDIPKPLNPPVVSSTPPPPPPSQQQTISSQPPVTVQDVYRPGGLLSTNQPQIPSLSTNNNNYNPNQYVQYIQPTPVQQPSLPQPTPSPRPPLVPSSTSSTPNLPTKPVTPQPVIPNIVDDLLSLALEQQIESSTIETEIHSPEPQSPIPIDEEIQQKSNGKPIACIQPLPIVIEEKPIIQPAVTPVASLSPPQDPYDDKDKLDQLASDVQRFEKHVSTMTKKILNGTVPLEVEWKVR